MENIAIKVCRILHNAGFKVYFVGGCVRDKILGIEPKDYDIVTNATAKEVSKLFSSKIVGEAFEVSLVEMDGFQFEVATMRKDGDYSDGRHPDSIQLTSSIKEDLKRRDFTINAMAYDPIKDKKINSKYEHDLVNKNLVFVGDAETRCKEDKLRILRLFRFMSKLGFSTSQETLNIIQKFDLSSISKERIFNEWYQIVIGQNYLKTLDTMIKTGFLWQIFPELKKQQIGHDNLFHQETYFEYGNTILAHTLLVSQHMYRLSLTKSDEDKFILRMAALLHDIGKPATKQFIKGKYKYLKHEIVGAKIAEDLLTELRFPKKFIDPIVSLIRDHMKTFDLSRMKDIAKIKLLVNNKYWDYLKILSECDMRGTHNNLTEQELDNFFEACKKYEQYEGNLPKPAITGDDLIKAGYSPSPKFKKALDVAYKEQLRGKDKLLNVAIGILKA